MYYEINVALNGKHFFATAERSLRTTEDAKKVWDRLLIACPAEQGFTMELTYRVNSGYNLGNDPAKWTGNHPA